MTHIICDHLRLTDFGRQDTIANTPAEAQQKAAEMAQRFGCRVYVLGIVGVVECPAIEPHWVMPIRTE